uniref:Uncharacterized protein n=1 Tax=Helicotheca tamesis TaxID=374047 RepID=A0A7S2H6C0_9STRA|mmetsp:Transcript_15602/g.21330  ORF Transcript_15602/g.21330 Transcript_15602/m.21330 type:complete len:181 (+) Transcript_15602:67-609(+)|eukprot:CAMPEP_0185725640 /NCGR_PEP_ID=MMETSP1171-20130828/1845_1 /TAXON_ID=374046 /ORGANISM="Helicotheca tamensis, Strain CCMP826" /LENGTH=180 /DNA_ID=CAMNT_0028393815 /DNA_START=57 /DNA_END=599 /DNA_ORIENTATION=+
MKVLAVVALSASSVSAFAPASFGVRSSTAAQMADYDLDFGKKNDYIPQSFADGGQGQFGAISPNDWRVPGTSPVGEVSYSGASDGGDEPWFAEAVSTVSLDLAKADETLKAFTKEAAEFKMEEIAALEPYGFSSKEEAMDEIVGKLGYSKFLESSTKQIMKTWATMHPDPAEEKKKEEKK